MRAPSEACKTRVQSGIATSVPEAIQQVFLEGGGRSNTLKAWQSSLLRDVPMGALQIAIFESLKSYLIEAPYIGEGLRGTWRDLGLVRDL